MASSGQLKLAVLLSGGGRTLVNLHERMVAGSLDAKIDVVISSRADVLGVERSRALGLRTEVIERRGLPAETFDRRLHEMVADADLVCMAGFLCLWRIPNAMLGRVINIHPALLPAFGGRGMYGHHVHEAVLKAGKTVSGCTVHYCDNAYDHGPVIVQQKVPVLPDDTADSLAGRVFEQECIAYPEAISLIACGHVRFEAGKAVFV